MLDLLIVDLVIASRPTGWVSHSDIVFLHHLAYCRMMGSLGDAIKVQAQYSGSLNPIVLKYSISFNEVIIIDILG